ncbi:hypothetical protein DMENIID0001_016260 [Sergentomyia squamirostris]
MCLSSIHLFIHPSSHRSLEPLLRFITIFLIAQALAKDTAVNAAKNPQLTVSNLDDRTQDYPELKITSRMTKELPRPLLGRGVKLPINGKALRMGNVTEIPVETVEDDEDLQKALEDAALEGLNAMTEYYDRVEPEMVQNGSFLNVDDPAAFLWRFSAPHNVYKDNSRAAYASIVAATKLQER